MLLAKDVKNREQLGIVLIKKFDERLVEFYRALPKLPNQKHARE